MDVLENDKRFSKVMAFVKGSLKGYDSGHDWMHIDRVVRTSIYIYEREHEACLGAVILGALLHDVGDRKFADHDAKPEIRALLASLDIDASIADIVMDINSNISFSESDRKRDKSNELRIVQDADRLDAIGAIGIARAFNYGGFKNRSIYDPGYGHLKAGDMEAYRGSCSPTINHFYEKLLLLKDMMNTNTGKALAEDRHRFMELFLEQFYMEWNLGMDQPR